MSTTDPITTAKTENTQIICLRDGKEFALKFVTDPHGTIHLESHLSDAEEREEFQVTTAEMVAAQIFDFDYGDDAERPSEDACNEIGRKVVEKIITDPDAARIDTLELFLMALVAEGVHVDDQRFCNALENTLERMACPE